MVFYLRLTRSSEILSSLQNIQLTVNGVFHCRYSFKHLCECEKGFWNMNCLKLEEKILIRPFIMWDSYLHRRPGSWVVSEHHLFRKTCSRDQNK